jgi:hypothetical protein
MEEAIGIRFEEEGHKYYFIKSDGSEEDAEISVTGMLKFGFNEIGDSLLNIMAHKTYDKLKKLYFGFVKNQTVPYYKQSPLQLNRSREVSKHLNDFHSPFHRFLNHIIQNTEPTDAYDELVLFLYGKGDIDVYENQLWFPSTTGDRQINYVRDFWHHQINSGTALHKAIENFFVNNTFELENDDFMKWVEWWTNSGIQNEWKWYASEQIVFDYELKLAGSIDCILQHKTRQDEFLIVDWKRVKNIATKRGNSKKFVNENNEITEQGGAPFGTSSLDKYFVQLGMYKHLFMKMNKTKKVFYTSRKANALLGRKH